MKNYFLKSFALLAMLFSALNLSAQSGVDWSNIGWLGNGSDDAVNTDKYKVSPTDGLNIVNIQRPGWADEVGIYVTVPKDISACSVNGKINGAGVVLYLSSFTAQETQVTLTYGADLKCTFWVYYADGTGGGGGGGTPVVKYCDFLTGHLNNANFGDANGRCLLTLTKISDTKVRVTVKPNYANGATKKMDYLYVISSGGIPYPAEAGADAAEGGYDELSVDITYASAPATYSFTIQWSNVADGGRWQVTLENIAPELLCPEGGGEPEPGSPAVCVYEGGAGDALMEQPGKDQFKSGYSITVTLDEENRNKIHITATVLGDDAPATTAWFQNYPNYNYSQDTNEKQLEASGENTFETTISIDPFISNRADGIIRFAIKFEYPNQIIKVTTPEFFYLDGSGCAQRVFAIYHHDDLPAEPLEGEDQFTEYAGGRILQSIQYKRRMPSEVWETLSVPFDVDSVTAFDPETRKHVRLYAQYKDGSTQSGNYWLRYFQTSPVTRENFQSNWYDIEVNNQNAAKPVKNTAYIIRLPDGGGYYNNKYIVFHGRGYQTIADTYNAPDSPEDDHYSYSGNNTMMPQSLTSAYVLDNAGAYFTSSSTVTLHPFECSVNATRATIAKMPRIALNGRNNTTTDLTPLPTTDLQGGIIYSMYGACVARFNSIDEYDQACQNLATGIYIIVTSSTTTKIQIP